MKKLVTYCDICDKMIKKSPQLIAVAFVDKESKWSKEYSYDGHKKCTKQLLNKLKCLSNLDRRKGTCSICERRLTGQVFKVLKIGSYNIPESVADMEICSECARSFVDAVQNYYDKRCNNNSSFNPKPPISNVKVEKPTPPRLRLFVLGLDGEEL